MHECRRRAAVLAGASVLCAAPLAAGADASLRAVGGGADVAEVRRVVDVRFEGLVAEVTTRQVLANRGREDRTALYTFDLPARAALTSLAIELPGGPTARAEAIDREAALRPVAIAAAQEGAPDAGLLRRVVTAASPDGLDTYELRVYPVPAGGRITVRTRWTAPLRYQDGRLSLRLPDRGDAGNLSRARVRLRVRAPHGARGSASVRGGGRLLAKRAGVRSPRYRFRAPKSGPLALEASPRYLDPAPRARFAAVPLGDHAGAFAVAARAPRAHDAADPTYERVVLAVDVSRSMKPAGVRAAAAVADAVLVGAGHAAKVEAVLFDREVRRVLGGLSPNGKRARSAIAGALERDALRNGSDLGGALEEIGRTLEDAGAASDQPVTDVERGVTAPTLVVLLTDGMAPLSLNGPRALSRLGRSALGEARVMSVHLVPDGAALAAPPEVLSDLAHRTGGRTFTLRHAEAKARGPGLLGELAAAAPLDALSLDAGEATVTGLSLPSRLEPGEGFFAVGWYHGEPPDEVVLRGRRGGKEAVVRAQPARGPFASAAAALRLSDAAPIDFVPAWDREEVEGRRRMLSEDPRLMAARRRLAEAALDAGVAGRESSLVAVDPRDRFARDRMALAKRHGTVQYRRLPPPEELSPDHAAREPTAREETDQRESPGRRKTGELDRSIVRRLVRNHVVPRARACYERALRRDPERAGSLVVVAELARGEVQHARLEGPMARGGAFEGCVLRAAYRIRVPRVALGHEPEAIGVARYPLQFRRRKQRAQVRAGDDVEREPSREAGDNPEDPLHGLPD